MPAPLTHRDSDDRAILATGTLIEALASQVRPVSGSALRRRLFWPLVLGGGLSVVAVATTLGLRPDLLPALTSPALGLKLAYVLALGVLAVAALETLSRPAARSRSRLLALAAPPVIVFALAALQLGAATGADRTDLLMGATAAACPRRILMFSVPPFFALLWAVRGLAPTDLPLTGAVLGLCAGAVGATAYALACPETAIPFLATWYSLAIAIDAAIGAAAAPWILRW